MNEKILSFIVPVYNGETYIEDCVNQLMKNENRKDYEIILINDGSTDGSWRIMESFAAKYPDVIRAKNAENGGVSRARNMGLYMAHGDYVSFVDVDDFLADDFMKLLKKVLEEQGTCDIVFFQWERLFDRSNTKFQRTKGNNCLAFEPDQRKALIKNLLFPEDDRFASATLFSPCGKAVRREFLLTNGILFDTDMRIAEDVCWNIACLKCYEKMIYCQQTVYLYYCNRNSSGSRYNGYAETIGIESNQKIESMLGSLLSEPEICIANAYSVLYRYWWCVVADYYHIDNHDKISTRAKRMKKLKATDCYEKAFELLNDKMYEVMASNQRIVMKLVANDRFVMASFVCRLRIVFKKMKGLKYF